MTSLSADVVVLGAGPAGLGVALQVARAGRSVVVVERAPRVGGLAASIEIAEQRVDLGSHRLHPTTSPTVLGVLRDLLGDDLQIRRRNGRMSIAGRFVPFPPRIDTMLRTLPPRVSARLAFDAAVASARRDREPATFADAVRATLGPTMLREFYGPYAEKIWGEPPGALSAELARRRVSARTPWDLLRKAMRREPTGGAFFYPRRGFGQIVDALADAAVASSATLRLDDAVAAVAPGRDSVVVTTDAGVEIAAGHCVSTIPIRALVSTLGANVEPNAIVTANRLSSRGVVLVYLALDRPQWTPYDAHYLPALHTVIARISEPKNYRDSRDDPRDRTVLCAELPCTAGDALWTTDDDALSARVVAELRGSGLPNAEPGTTSVVRLPNVYPTYHVGYEHDLEAVDHAIGEWEKTGLLLTIGRQGAFAHDNSHHALDQAFAAAGAITSGGFDHRAWLIAKQGFASHVVED